MARYGRMLTDAEWEKIRPLLPQRPPRPRGGRPPANNRKVLEGILWILRSGARWQDLPEEFPSPATCWRRLRDWEAQGGLASDLARLSGRVERTAAVELERVLYGRQLCSGEKRGFAVGKTKRGKGTKWMVVVDGGGVPLGIRLYPASLAEVRLAEETLDAIRVGRRRRGGRPRQKPTRVIADKGYDSDALRARLRRRGVMLIAPHRSNRCRTAPQDGRVLRRYKKRWIVERSIAWLDNYRRPVVRYDHSLTIYQAFVHIACLMIVLRKVLK